MLLHFPLDELKFFFLSSSLQILCTSDILRKEKMTSALDGRWKLCQLWRISLNFGLVNSSSRVLNKRIGSFRCRIYVLYYLYIQQSNLIACHCRNGSWFSDFHLVIILNNFCVVRNVNNYNYNYISTKVTLYQSLLSCMYQGAHHKAEYWY